MIYVLLHRSLGFWILLPMVVAPARTLYYDINTVVNINMIPWYGSIRGSDEAVRYSRGDAQD